MSKPTDMRVTGAELFFLPVETRVPLKFGPETLTHVTCARVRFQVAGADGKKAEGWGETPLSVQWAWPCSLSYDERHEEMKSFCEALAKAWVELGKCGHAMEIGQAFLADKLPALLETVNAGRTEPMPWLAALICCSRSSRACPVAGAASLSV